MNSNRNEENINNRSLPKVFATQTIQTPRVAFTENFVPFHNSSLGPSFFFPPLPAESSLNSLFKTYSYLYFGKVFQQTNSHLLSARDKSKVRPPPLAFKLFQNFHARFCTVKLFENTEIFTNKQTRPPRTKQRN